MIRRRDATEWPLRLQKEPDIDQLVPKVDKAMKAYSICKDRLIKVQETLGKYFDSDETEDEARQAKGNGVVRRAPVPSPSDDRDEGDIPF